MSGLPGVVQERWLICTKVLKVSWTSMRAGPVRMRVVTVSIGPALLAVNLGWSGKGC